MAPGNFPKSLLLKSGIVIVFGSDEQSWAGGGWAHENEIELAE